jgi:hypothetical protein
MPGNGAQSRWPPLTTAQKLRRQQMRDVMNEARCRHPLTASKLTWVLIRLPPDAQRRLATLLWERNE